MGQLIPERSLWSTYFSLAVQKEKENFYYKAGGRKKREMKLTFITLGDSLPQCFQNCW